MAEALSLEKTSTRYRICMIQEFAIQNLLATRNTANVLYEKLESWIDYAYKIENDALEEMVCIFFSQKLIFTFYSIGIYFPTVHRKGAKNPDRDPSNELRHHCLWIGLELLHPANRDQARDRKLRAQQDDDN